MTLPSALYDQRLKASHARTRRPLSLYYTEAVPSGSQDIPDDTCLVQTHVVGNLEDDLSAPEEGANGYATGNASHLHIQINNNDTGEDLTLYAYNYVFKSWAPMYLPLGQNQATTDASYVIATWATIDGAKYVTVPIHGIDRIAFIEGSSTDANYVIKAAVSTF
jgi:hypothetical protein